MNLILRQIRFAALKKGLTSFTVILAVLVTLCCSITTNLFPTNSPIPITGAPLPTSSLVPTTGAPLPGLIAYEGNDGNIYTIDQDGKQKTAVTQDANLNPNSGKEVLVYQYPTWAPDSQNLAFMGFSGTDPSQSQANLYTAGSNGKNRVAAFTSQDTFPFYLFWSPNSDYIGFLSNDPAGNGLILQIAAAAGGNNKVIGTGQPYYWDWAPDNRSIIVHSGGAASDNPDALIAQVGLDGSLLNKVQNVKPGSFQAPDWSPQGDEMAMITQNSSSGEDLVIAGPDGTTKLVLAKLSGLVAFAWSPKGDSLAYLTSVDSDPTGLKKSLVLSDPTRADSGKEIAKGDIVAYFWSPDSQKLAYFLFSTANPGQTSQNIAQRRPQISLQVQVYDLASGETRLAAANFQPTDAFQQVFPFFDQYQRSATIWSPDSKNLVLSAVDNAGKSNIIVVSKDGGKFQKIADGDLAFWSWK